MLRNVGRGRRLPLSTPLRGRCSGRVWVIVFYLGKTFLGLILLARSAEKRFWSDALEVLWYFTLNIGMNVFEEDEFCPHLRQTLL